MHPIGGTNWICGAPLWKTKALTFFPHRGCWLWCSFPAANVCSPALADESPIDLSHITYQGPWVEGDQKHKAQHKDSPLSPLRSGLVLIFSSIQSGVLWLVPTKHFSFMSHITLAVTSASHKIVKMSEEVSALTKGTVTTCLCHTYKLLLCFHRHTKLKISLRANFHKTLFAAIKHFH